MDTFIDMGSHKIYPYKGTIIRNGDNKSLGVASGSNNKYLRTHIDGINNYNHRRIYEAFHKTTLQGNDQINHINHDTKDNRISNLEKVTPRQNREWTKKRINNKSGFTGVTFDKSKNRWKAFLKSEGKYKHLGYFIEIDDAIKARIKECNRLNTLGHKIYIET